MSMVGFSGTCDLSGSRNEEDLEVLINAAKRDIESKKKRVEKSRVAKVAKDLDIVGEVEEEREGDDEFEKSDEVVGKPVMDLRDEEKRLSGRSHSECSEATTSEFDEITEEDEETEDDDMEEEEDEEDEDECVDNNAEETER